VQAGAFGEHQFTEAKYKATGDVSSQLEDRTTRVDEKCLHVHMPAATKMSLDLGTKLFVNQPTYAFPWK